jgi:hypothetical protein
MNQQSQRKNRRKIKMLTLLNHSVHIKTKVNQISKLKNVENRKNFHQLPLVKLYTITQKK